MATRSDEGDTSVDQPSQYTQVSGGHATPSLVAGQTLNSPTRNWHPVTNGQPPAANMFINPHGALMYAQSMQGAPQVFMPYHDNRMHGPNQPIHEAFNGQVLTSSVALASTPPVHGLLTTGTPVQNPTAPIPIDPTLVPIPVPSHATVPIASSSAVAAKLKGRALPVEKIAGRRRGRPAGSPNFSQEDSEMLLVLIEEHLPIGQVGWNKVHADFNKFATAEKRPQRHVDSLKNKFTTWIKTTKPTGDGVCPPEVLKARKLNDLINEKVLTGDLSDSEADRDDNGSTNGDDAGDDSAVPPPSTMVTAPPPTQPAVTAVVTARAQRNVSASVEKPARQNSTATDAVRSLVRVMDPSAQRARDLDRGERFSTSTQMMAMSQQLRDTQMQTEALRRENNDLRDRLQASERAKDLAEMHLTIERRVKSSSRSSRRRSRRSRTPSSSRSRSPSYDDYDHPSHRRKGHKSRRYHYSRPRSRDDFGRVNCPQLGEDTPYTAIVEQHDGRLKIKRKQESTFSDGGGHVAWLTDGSPYTPAPRPFKRARLRSPTPGPHAGPSKLHVPSPHDSAAATPAHASNISLLINTPQLTAARVVVQPVNGANLHNEGGEMDIDQTN